MFGYSAPIPKSEGEKHPALLKARKNLSISFADLKILTDGEDEIKKSTVVTILKKLLRKHKTLKIAAKTKLPKFCSQICQSISRF